MAYLDTRDLAKRLEELKDEKEGLISLIDEKEEEIDDKENEIEECEFDDEREVATDDLVDLQEELKELKEEFQNWIEENQEELEELEGLENQISEWSDGNTMIPEEDFVDYCQELCEDIGDLPSDLPGYIVIDWEATADNLKVDYSEVEYQGETYLVRD